MVMRKRKFAFHMKGELPTIEGILVHRRNRHFGVLGAQIVEAEDRTVSLTGYVEIPRENVYILQVIE